jgi:hypothetical protein
MGTGMGTGMDTGMDMGMDRGRHRTIRVCAPPRTPGFAGRFPPYALCATGIALWRLPLAARGSRMRKQKAADMGPNNGTTAASSENLAVLFHRAVRLMARATIVTGMRNTRKCTGSPCSRAENP